MEARFKKYRGWDGTVYRVQMTREEIKEMIKDLEPGTMLTLEMSDRTNENDHDRKEGGE